MFNIQQVEEADYFTYNTNRHKIIMDFLASEFEYDWVADYINFGRGKISSIQQVKSMLDDASKYLDEEDEMEDA